MERWIARFLPCNNVAVSFQDVATNHQIRQCNRMTWTSSQRHFYCFQTRRPMDRIQLICETALLYEPSANLVVDEQLVTTDQQVSIAQCPLQLQNQGNMAKCISGALMQKTDMCKGNPLIKKPEDPAAAAAHKEANRFGPWPLRPILENWQECHRRSLLFQLRT